jgi:hypothetical protein
MGEPVKPDITAVQRADPSEANKSPQPSADGQKTPGASVVKDAGPASDRADLRPESINDAVIRLAGNSQDGAWPDAATRTS